VGSQTRRALIALLLVALTGIGVWVTRPADRLPLAEPAANGPILYVRRFITDDTPPFGEFTSAVYRMNPGGEESHLLLDGGTGTLFYAFAPFPDGQSVLLTRAHFRAGTEGVLQLDLAHNTLRKPYSCPGIGCFGTMVPSPDGRRIAVVKGLNVYVMNFNGSDLIQLTRCDPPGTRRHPPDSCYIIDGVDWSPDGSRLVFAQQTFRGFGRLFVMNEDGSDLHQITECQSRLCLGGARDGFPDWAPDGDEIVFHREHNVYAVRPDGTGLRRVTRCPLVHLASKRTCEAEYPIWSPDGSLIAFQGMDGIYLIDPDGGGQRQIGPKGAELRAWMPG
jgi:Tol biopolymer transport system component